MHESFTSPAAVIESDRRHAAIEAKVRERLRAEDAAERARIEREVMHRPWRPYVPPTAPTDQDELRDRRRKRMGGVVYGREFNLVAEVAVVCAPLADVLDGDLAPAELKTPVWEVISAVSAVIGVAAKAVTDREHRRKLVDVAPVDRADALRSLRTLTPPPQPPTVTVAALADRSWLDTLAAAAQPWSARFSDVLGSVPRPDDRVDPDIDDDERERLAARAPARYLSDDLVDALRDLDRVVSAAVTRVRRRQEQRRVAAEFHARQRARKRAAQSRPQHSQQAARAELTRLGVSVPVDDLFARVDRQATR